MGDLTLDGCRPEPLGSYLKALGVFRLVAEQPDPTVAARWDGDRLVLTTNRPLDEIVEFFADSYCPTPIVSPWNKGSGFHPKDNTDGIEAVMGSTTDRLLVFRDAVATARDLVAHDRWPDLGKDEQVRWCRNVLPDAAVPWLDAAVVLSDSGAVFPPILGTGGNVGRLDFSNNFMQRVGDALAIREGRGAPTADDSVGWLWAALAGRVAPKLVKKAVGQFDPGAAGGTNAPAGGVEESLVNPWDFVLTFEGALLFASGVARRMGSGAGGRGKAAMPFTFDTSPVGYPSAVDGENAKGELWAPFWSRPALLAEVARLLGEGRMEWGPGHARRGIDAARAATSLGVDRGITGFVRHTFVERMGQAMLALPVGRVATAVGEREDVAVLADLDDWVERVRRAKNLPAGPATTLRRLDQAMFALATDKDDHPRGLQDVLVVAAELERAVARSRALRGDVPRPLGSAARGRSSAAAPAPLEASRWAPLLADRSPELRLAMALASGRDGAPTAAASGPDGKASDAGRPGDRRDTPAALLRSVRMTHGRWLEWRPDGKPVVAGLSAAGLVDVLGALVRRRAIETSARPDDRSEGTYEGQRGIDPGFAFRLPAPLDDVADFVAGRVDDERLAKLLGALLLLRSWWQATVPPAPAGAGAGPPSRIPAAVALVLPFFHGWPFAPFRADRPIRLRMAPQWPQLLAAGRVEEVVADALHRLRIARLDPLVGDVCSLARDVDGPRLLAAATFPLSNGSAAALVRRVTAPQDDHRPSTYPEGTT